MTVKQRIAERYRAGNKEAARIVASDPVKYPGVMQKWASLVLVETNARPADAEAGPLFAGRLKWAPEIDHDRPEARARD
ncbi:MAG TPA: hypothetical protein VN622_05770 [Clostridia bacterium]|nr:hypothetical protein [Clostridia bacterium]